MSLLVTSAPGGGDGAWVCAERRGPHGTSATIAGGMPVRASHQSSNASSSPECVGRRSGKPAVGSASSVVEESGHRAPALRGWVRRRRVRRRPTTRRCRRLRRGSAAQAATVSGTGGDRPRAPACPPTRGAWRSWPRRRRRSDGPRPGPAPLGPVWPGRTPSRRCSRSGAISRRSRSKRCVYIPPELTVTMVAGELPPQQRRHRRGEYIRAEHLGRDGQLHTAGRRPVGAGRERRRCG